jgi:hypothetical protein
MRDGDQPSTMLKVTRRREMFADRGYRSIEIRNRCDSYN